MAEILEHFLFRKYSKALKEWINDNLYLSRYPKDQNLQTIYATPARAFAKYLYNPIVNGEHIRPTLSFYLAQPQYSVSENILGYQTEKRVYTDTGVTKIIKPPLIYSLTYTVAIRTLLMSDMDILLYQLLTKAHKNKKAALIVDGQWMEIMAGDPRLETNLEPGDAQDRIVRYGLDITVPRAYLPREYSETGIIEEYDLTYNVVEELV